MVDGKEVPTFDRTVALSAPEQFKLEQQQALEVGLNDVAGQQLSRVNDVLSAPLDVSTWQFPNRVQTPDGPQLWAAADTPGLNGVGLNAGYFGNLGQQQKNIDLGTVGTTLESSGNVQGSVPITNSVGTFGDAGALTKNVAAPNAQEAIGGYGDFARNLTQSNAAGTYANAGNVQNALSGTQSAAGTYANAGDIQKYLSGLQLNNQAFGTTGNIQNSIGNTDFSQDRKAVEDAIYSRVNPQLDRDRAALETKLVNQGFERGTDAFNTQMGEFNRQANDMRMQAVLASGQEQTRLSNIALQSGQFANTAQQQMYGQQLGRGQFSNEATNANNQLAAMAGQFANSAQAQAAQEALQRGQFQQQGATINNQLAQMSGQFANSAQAQAAQEAFQRGQFANQTTAQNNQAAQIAAQYGMGAQQQAYNQSEGQAELFNRAIQQNAATGFQNAQLNNSQQQQLYDQYMGRAGFSNQAAQQNNQANMQAGQFANTAQAQTFAQNQARAQYGLEATGMNNQVVGTEAEFYNQAQNAAVQQYMQQVQFQNQAQLQQEQFNNATAQQDYGNQITRDTFDNANAQTLFNTDMARAGYQNSNREAAIQEALALRNQPINEIASLMNGGQVSLPQFAPYQYNPMAPPPVADSVYKSADIEMQNYQMQLQAQAAQTAGLFGLLGSGVTGMMKYSDRDLKRDVVDLGISLLNGLKLYAFKYLWDDTPQVGFMADEVEAIFPRAVANVNGYRAVNYSLAMGAA